MSSQAAGYIAELIGETQALYLPEGVESYTNRAIRWGQQCEEEARRYYCMDRQCDVTNGGFCTTDDGRFGASPDFLVEPDGCGELKCPQPGTHVEYILGRGLPEIYKPQVHGHLIVTGRKWCDFLSYAPGLKPLLVRVEADDFTQSVPYGVQTVRRGVLLLSRLCLLCPPTLPPPNVAPASVVPQRPD